MMNGEFLEIKGIRQNNLKNISIRVPHDKIIVVTGVSGSGKSSLAFDTIFAEGQWRFIESLSSYARLFLEKLDRPDVDEVLNIRPAIALEQRNPVKGSRSTVGTVTEVYDLLRVLFSRIATMHCPGCAGEIKKWDAAQVLETLLKNYEGRKAVILFETGEALSSLRERGFFRVFADGRMREVSFDEPDGNPNNTSAKTRDIVVDRLVVRNEPRLSDSVELAWREGQGRLKILIVGEAKAAKTAAAAKDSPGVEELVFSQRSICDRCGRALPEPMPLLFSFNHPVGACPECKGFGNVLKYDRELIVPDKSRSLAGGAVEPWEKPSFRRWRSRMLKSAQDAGLDIDKPLIEFSDADWKILFEGKGKFHGIDDFFEYLEGKRYKLHVRVFLSFYRSAVECPACGGRRLKDEVLCYKVNGLDISEFDAMTLGELNSLFSDPPFSAHQREIVHEVLRHLKAKLGFLVRVGLDYLTLVRRTSTLSGGEYQRVNLSNQLSGKLAGTLYVLDEPTIGLHCRDNEKISEVIRQLAGQGNTVMMVEHDPQMIRMADWVLELGPGGGSQGGQVVFSGTADDFRQSGTLTARCVTESGKAATVISSGRPHPRRLKLTGARGNNLKNVSINIPLGALTVVSGVSGSGKSTLVVDTLYNALARHFKQGENHPLEHASIEGIQHVKAVKLVDQSPIGRSPRSNPATYLKFFDPIRKIFSGLPESRVFGYGPGYFSFNVPGGRCELCKGEGFQRLEMYFFEDLFVRCDECSGRRYSAEALNVRYKGLSISHVLELTVEDAAGVFSEHPTIVKKLALLKEMGLGYMKIGQPATTLSGGEAQRLKLCADMGANAKKDCIYILDEPTIGLHMHDVKVLMTALKHLIEMDNTVVIIEHNMDVIRQADWVIDLGPEGGHRGGQVLFEGLPESLAGFKGSYTGKYLR
jgi:excinuclease ABC subunit A